VLKPWKFTLTLVTLLFVNPERYKKLFWYVDSEGFVETIWVILVK